MISGCSSRGARKVGGELFRCRDFTVDEPRQHPFDPVGDGVGRRHPAAGVGAISERREGQRARLVILGIGQRRGRRADHRLQTGGEAPRSGAERDAGGEAAEPVARADPRAEIGDEVDIGVEGGQPLAETARDGGTTQGGIEAERRRSATVAGSDIVKLIQGEMPPCDPLNPRRRAGRLRGL